ncbi:uncharacterized protein LOC122501870 [Leptopilina heterotoma]|uniref:uncharacterized protein LOC122501870 n=1 Tax=Leptopilina heterotoma TaxID=63436 RepID=UPI001CA8ACD2|nr:uncharacterized protein LOC122501870 [Leptopilina heterotoma]
MEILKSSRHSRNEKRIDSDFTDGEHGSNGTTTNKTFTSQLKKLDINSLQYQARNNVSPVKRANVSGDKSVVEVAEKIVLEDEMAATESHAHTSKETESNGKRPEGPPTQDQGQGRDQIDPQEVLTGDSQREDANAGRGKKRKSSRFSDDPQEVDSWNSKILPQ